jgi:hypothetical protein
MCERFGGGYSGIGEGYSGIAMGLRLYWRCFLLVFVTIYLQWNTFFSILSTR